MGKITQIIDTSEARDLRELVDSGRAQTIQEAEELLEQRALIEAETPIAIFYTDFQRVRSAFKRVGSELRDEQVYENSSVRMAFVHPRFLNKPQLTLLRKQRVAVGEILEHVSRDRQDAKVIAYLRDFPYADKRGVVLSPYSAESMGERGVKGFAEQRNLYRIECPKARDSYVLGMFSKWNQELGEDFSLALWRHQDKMVFFDRVRGG